MTGNDIVDMQAAAIESNWRRKGFLEKIFTRQEQEYILHAALPDSMVWRLWTMKESAYKIYTRQYGGRFFAPTKFNCTLLCDATGLVRFNNIISYQTITITAKGHIYTIATAGETKSSEFINSCFCLPETDPKKQQQYVYKKIIECYQSLTVDPKKNIAVNKDKNGIPFLNCSNNLQIPVSITHHGRFAAFTILK